MQQVVDTTHWWEIVQAFGPIAILIAAAFAFFGVHRTLSASREAHEESMDQIRQAAETERHDRDREQWWARVSWCLSMCSDSNDLKRQVGFSVVPSLLASELAGPEEKQMINAAMTRLFFDFQAVPGVQNDK